MDNLKYFYQKLFHTMYFYSNFPLLSSLTILTRIYNPEMLQSLNYSD